MKRLRRGVFLYLEDSLFHYFEMLNEIKRIRTDIIFGSKSKEYSMGRSSFPADFTATRAIELVSNARLERLQRLTETIQSVIDRLQPEKKELVKLIYWDRPRLLTWEGAAQRLHITKRTAYRWRREIISAIADRGGFE